MDHYLFGASRLQWVFEPAHLGYSTLDAVTLVSTFSFFLFFVRQVFYPLHNLYTLYFVCPRELVYIFIYVYYFSYKIPITSR